MPERKLRNSNKWIQGIEAAVGFLWVIFPIASKERMNIFQGMSIGEKYCNRSGNNYWIYHSSWCGKLYSQK